MAYTVLARRYRSATFDEVVGQNHVAQTLKKAIESGRIAHAFLFSGTRGVGKTSMARILAKALNCEKANGPTTEPCLHCASCQAIARGEDMDVIEIDAASNTQVEKTRDVILDNAQYRPARGRFKVYIIDEVHMLSKASFNALLKTLEEPPEHVKFILATTEPEKILPTILSRCQRYDFRNIPTREIAEHLRSICKDEKIKADEDALMLVAKAGVGSMRDSLSLLDRLLSIGEKQLTVETIEQLLGLPHSQRIFDLVQAIGEGRVKDVLVTADAMVTQGLSTDSLLASLIDHLRNLLVIRACGADSTLVEAAALSLADLTRQADRFDAVVLTQDITILEELRRLLRISQAGRALLDATLVRLALAEQFSSIGELLQSVDFAPSAGSAAQKKKPEPGLTGSPAAVAVPPPSLHRPTTIQPVPESEALPSAVTVDVDVDDDDDLPRPGKVWEGPSLAEALRTQAMSAPAATAAPPPAAPTELTGIWSGLLAKIEEHGAGLHALVSAGRLASIEDGLATVRFSTDRATFLTMLNRNGKRELISEVLSGVIGRAVGVRFEVDAEADAVATASATPVAAAAAPAPAHKPAGTHVIGPAAAAPAPAPAVHSIRPSPEQMREFEQDPLIGALMKELGATIVRITED